MGNPTYFFDDPTVAAREPEVLDADFKNGMNVGGCMPGIGIALDGEINLTGEPNGWTLLDQGLYPTQTPAARNPQDGQSIGGVGIEGGETTAPDEPFDAVTNDDDGLGGVTVDGTAALVTLAAGWTLGI